MAICFCEELTKFAEFVETQSTDAGRKTSGGARLEEEEAICEAEALAALHGGNRQ